MSRAVLKEGCTVERRLAAILYADVAGYSRLTGVDEEGTHRSLRESLGELSQTIERHRGRICHFAGDAVLVEFATVTGAVECGLDAQRQFAARNVGVPAESQMRFRIGINLGDVIVDGHEIYGDGVNVAARLESLADPGGICISGTVYQAMEGKFDLPVDDLQEQRVKNIERPIHVYRIRPERIESGDDLSRRGKSKSIRWAVMVFLLCGLIVGAAAAVWLIDRERSQASADQCLDHLGLPVPKSECAEVSQQ